MNTMQDFITNGIRESCYRFQGRVAGSESEHACQKHFAMQLREWSDNVEIEDFKLHPTAFLGWIPICAVSMILSIFLIWKSTQSTAVLPIILAVCLTVFSALMLWFEFFRYRKFIDFLFPERTSHNVYAVRRSKNAPKQRIIFGGHADAAYEFRFIHIAKGKLGIPLIIGGVSGIILLTVSAVLILLNKIGGDNASWLYSIIEMAGLLYLPIFIAMLFFTNWKRITDGANDNLSACYAAMAVMKYLKENGIRYDDTEVCCLITGAEESGLRGAEYFAKKHKGELSKKKEEPTTPDSCTIVLFPEFVTLKAEVEKLRTEISMLLLERDELRLVVCKNIETAYMLALGSLEYKAFELHCEFLRLKRKIDLVQAKKNRQEKVVISAIEKILDEEFEEYQQQLDEQINKMNKALDHSKGRPLTEEETKEVKKTYRNIVKALHPDLHPDITPAQIQLFQNAVQAYENGDLNSLRIISEMVAEPVISEKSENGLTILTKEKERLSKTIELIREQITEIKSEYPYTMKDLVDDPEKIAKKKAELEETINELKEAYDIYAERLKEMLR